jgi:hypothetical protein
MSFKYSFTFEAAYAGDLEELKRMHQSGYRCYDHTMDLAIEGGHMACVVWLHSIECPWSQGSAMKAVSLGNLDCLRYILEHGGKLCVWTIIYAARYGRLECLQLLRQYGCEWKKSCVTDAADNGHWDCVEYAINDGCGYHYPDLILFLDKNNKSFDFDRHHTIAKIIWPYIDSEYMNENTNTNCWTLCKAKMEEVSLLKQYATLVWHELPADVVEYVICSYFELPCV